MQLHDKILSSCCESKLVDFVMARFILFFFHLIFSDFGMMKLHIPNRFLKVFVRSFRSVINNLIEFKGFNEIAHLSYSLLNNIKDVRGLKVRQDLKKYLFHRVVIQTWLSNISLAKNQVLYFSPMPKCSLHICYSSESSGILLRPQKDIEVWEDEHSLQILLWTLV